MYELTYITLVILRCSQYITGVILICPQLSKVQQAYPTPRCVLDIRIFLVYDRWFAECFWSFPFGIALRYPFS